MKTIILTIVATILSLSTSYAEDLSGYKYNLNHNLPQKICVSIDKNAGNSRWTRRDNTAKFDIQGQYRHIVAFRYPINIYRGIGRTELHYGQAPVCKDFSTDPYLKEDRGRKFTNKIRIGVQYGGDCWITYNAKKAFDVTLYKRRGDLVNPWGCKYTSKNKQ